LRGRHQQLRSIFPMLFGPVTHERRQPS
jgi:hypothetical protein